LAAISKLEEMGADAKTAGAALVEFGMMSPNPKVQEAANAAFEKIDPLVHKEVLTVLIDQSLVTRNQAVESLKQLGARAKAAVPAIKLYHNNLCQGLMESGGKLAVRPNRGLHPPMHTLKALVAISPEDADVQKLILGIVGGPDTGMPREPGFTVVPRAEMIAIMHSLKVENKQKYAAFIAGLSASKQDRPLLIQELGKLGPDAKAALPILQALKTDKDVAVRTAAAAAIEAIKE
jgi:hypothetical protein